MHKDGLTVYWQPGCSSCLRAKEFLKKNGLDYHSINVREDTEAMDRLAQLGARSIPVVTSGDEFVYAQDIDVLARFVGLEKKRSVLPIDELFQRIDLLLAAAQRYLGQLENDSLDNTLPGRDRSYYALGYHVFVIPLAFLDAIAGKELSYEYFERVPPENMHTISALNQYGQSIRDSVLRCQKEKTTAGLPDKVQTYYGVQSTHSVLERTAWHTAHHVRQLMELVKTQGESPNGPLGEKELSGLPLPDEVYDDEVAMS